MAVTTLGGYSPSPVGATARQPTYAAGSLPTQDDKLVDRGRDGGPEGRCRATCSQGIHDTHRQRALRAALHTLQPNSQTLPSKRQGLIKKTTIHLVWGANHIQQWSPQDCRWKVAPMPQGWPVGLQRWKIGPAQLGPCSCCRDLPRMAPARSLDSPGQGYKNQHAVDKRALRLR